MCRNIKTLFNFDPPASETEINEASLQFVRKLSGFNKPSGVNEKVFYESVGDISDIAQKLLNSLQTNAMPKNRQVEVAKSRLRANKRFGV